MDIVLLIKKISAEVLPIPLVLILVCSIIITFKTRFVQIRMLPRMFRLLGKSLFGKKTAEGKGDSIQSHKALFTAMSTTLGIGNIVGPAIAIRLGGPGAMLGFLIAIFFGAATTFAEVTFSMNYRKQFSDGTFAGGPMQYLKDEISPYLASIYAYAGALLLVVWSSNQSNTLADILETYSISKYLTGLVISGLVTFYLIGGIKKIGNIASKIVPFMFCLYCSASLWVILCNFSRIPAVFQLMFQSAFSIQGLTGAAVGLTVQRMLRWGLARGIQASESGLGTATIPHSKSKTKVAVEQGILSMVSIYSVGFISLLSGLVILLTGTWQDASVGLGINMLAKSFSMYFPQTALILAVTSFLFAYGTILGNAFNGSQCYLYATKNRWINYYYVLIAIVVFCGCIIDVELIWTITDFFIIIPAFANLIGLLILVFRKSELLKVK